MLKQEAIKVRISLLKKVVDYDFTLRQLEIPGHSRSVLSRFARNKLIDIDIDLYNEITPILARHKQELQSRGAKAKKGRKGK